MLSLAEPHAAARSRIPRGRVIVTFAGKTMRLSTGARLVGHLASEPCAERSHYLVWEPVTGVNTELDRLATKQRERPGLNDLCAGPPRVRRAHGRQFHTLDVRERSNVGGHTLGGVCTRHRLCAGG